MSYFSNKHPAHLGYSIHCSCNSQHTSALSQEYIVHFINVDIVEGRVSGCMALADVVFPQICLPLWKCNVVVLVATEENKRLTLLLPILH